MLAGRRRGEGRASGIEKHEAMSDDPKPETPKRTGPEMGRVIFGILVFGVLMGIRGEFASLWIRMLVAACAGAVLAICVLPLRSDRR
jgi:hypothetical protein